MPQVVINSISNAQKVFREYTLIVQRVDDNGIPINDYITISSPITAHFTVNRSLFAEANTLDIELFNLSPNTYKELFFDYFNRKFRKVALMAGYQSTGLNLIFYGDMWSCYTSREGTETITKIHCIVGLDSMQQQSDITLAGASRYMVLSRVAQDMGLDLKIYSGENTKFNRPQAITGNSMAIAQKYSGNNAFIDGKDLLVLDNVDAIKGEVPLINDQSGLLGVPKHEDAILSVDIIFEPRIVIGQIIEVNSRIHPMFNGQYKVYGIRHEGVISGAESGKVVTTLEMLVGSQIYGRFGVVTLKHQEKSS